MFRSVKSTQFRGEIDKTHFYCKAILKPASHVLNKQNKHSGYTIATLPRVFELGK